MTNKYAENKAVIPFSYPKKKHFINLQSSLYCKDSSNASDEIFKVLNSNNIEFREKKFYVNSSEKINYLFNSSIKGIEDSDLILLIGTNPRHEATMVNARIRKVYANRKIPVYSIGNPGDLTYEYNIIGETTAELRDIIKGQNSFSKKLLSSKKPIVIIGESALELKSGAYIFEEVKEFLKENNFINDSWNALNILTKNASTVGAIDLKFFNVKESNNFIFFDKLKNSEFKLVYLLGSDNLKFEKNDTFIIYQGSHGDRGAEIADVILPSPAYTEQNGLYINLEGRVQECRKASYPPGNSLEDWKIFNLLLEKLGKEVKNKNYQAIKEATLKNVVNFSQLDVLPKVKFHNGKKIENDFINEKISIKKIDYYFSNSIARASKTMSDCRSVVNKQLKNGTIS